MVCVLPNVVESRIAGGVLMGVSNTAWLFTNKYICDELTKLR